jgi:hypothetical protein
MRAIHHSARLILVGVIFLFILACILSGAPAAQPAQNEALGGYSCFSVTDR